MDDLNSIIDYTESILIDGRAGCGKTEFLYEIALQNF